MACLIHVLPAYVQKQAVGLRNTSAGQHPALEKALV
jgi:DNA-binding transcriptional regulator YdaS (Cro superfamily)